ncbi:hypothetical protein Lser_V15G04364 [Lactuca serriola]
MILRDTTQLFSLNPNDFDESVRVMIEFISIHPIHVPLTKIPNPKFPLSLLELAFKRVLVKDDCIEVTIIDDRVATVTKSTFLRAVGVDENPEGFVATEIAMDQFQAFLSEIGFKGIYKAKQFNKSAVPGLWTVLLHIIMKGLSGKHGGTDSMSKEWLNLAYSFFTGFSSTVDLPKVMWDDFCKFTKRRKDNEIPSPRFWALTLQQLYSDLGIPISTDSSEDEVYVSFKTIKSYRIPNQSDFGAIRRLPEHMLSILPSDSPFKAKHLADTDPTNPSVPTPSPSLFPSEREKLTSSRKKQLPKAINKRHAKSPTKTKASKKTKSVQPCEKDSQIGASKSSQNEPPISSQKDDIGVEHSSLQRIIPTTQSQPTKIVTSPKQSDTGVVPPMLEVPSNPIHSGATNVPFLDPIVCDEGIDKDEKDVEEMLSEKNNTKVSNVQMPSDLTKNLQASSSKPHIDIDLLSLLDEIKETYRNDSSDDGNDDNEEDNDDESEDNSDSSNKVTIDPSDFIHVKQKVESVGVKVDSLDKKLDLVIKALTEIKASTPSIQDREKQLDELISIRLKHSREVSEARLNETLKHHMGMMDQMLKVHNQIVDAVKFDAIHKVVEDVMEELKKQSPTVETYDNLSKIINLSFRKVLEKIGGLKDQIKLAPMAGAFDARGKEGVCDLNMEYKLRDDDSDEEMQISQSKKTSLSEKIISNETKSQLSTWRVTYSEVVNKRLQDAKAKRLKLGQTFKASQSTKSPIIAPIDQ